MDQWNVQFSCERLDYPACRDRVLQRAGGGQDEIRGDCLSCRSSLRDASDAVMTLTVCVIKNNATMKLSDEQAPVQSSLVNLLSLVNHSPTI